MPFSLTMEDETILHLKDLYDEDRIIYEKVLLVPPQRHETRQKMDSYYALTQTLEQTLKQNSVKYDHTITNEEVDQARCPLPQISQEPWSLIEYLPSSRSRKPNLASLVLVIVRCPLMGDPRQFLLILSFYKGFKNLY